MNRIKSFFSNSANFRFTYIFTLFFCNIAYLQIPAYGVLVFLFIWGVVLCFRNQRDNSTFNVMRFGMWVSAFLVSNLVAMLFNFSIMIWQSVVMLLHLLICFCLFYGIHTEPKANYIKEFYKICRALVYLVTAIDAIGITLLMCGVSYKSKICPWIEFIIYENRFTGLFINPNILGFVSVVALVCCHMLYKKNFKSEANETPVSRIWLATCGLASMFSLLLCDSNASMVLAIGYVIAYTVYRLFSAEHSFSKRQILQKLCALCLVGVLVIFSSFYFRIICQKGFAAVVSSTSSITTQTTNPSNASENKLKDENKITFTHENENLDSGRFKLIRESVDLFVISPVFGISNGNIVLYSMDNNGALTFSYHKSDLHNGYLTLLVSTGIVGFGFFATFGFRFAKHIIQNLFKDKKLLGQDIFPCLFSFLCGYLVYALFEKALLYDVSFMVMWFWLIMGIASTYLNKYEPIYDNKYHIYKKRLRRNIF